MYTHTTYTIPPMHTYFIIFGAFNLRRNIGNEKQVQATGRLTPN